MLILDVSDPANSFMVGTFNTPGEARCVTVADDYAYIADGPSGFEIFDIKNPVNPSLMGWYSGLTNVNQLVAKDGFLYVADGTTGTHIFDVTSPDAPSEVTNVNFTGWISIQGNYGYVCGPYGLLILDVSDPANPINVATNADLGGDAIAIQGTNAFVVGGTWLHILDINDPTNPVPVIRYYPNNIKRLHRVAVSGKYAYVSNEGGPLWPEVPSHSPNVRMISISDLNDPQQVSVLPGGEGIFVTGELAYMAGFNGLSMHNQGQHIWGIFTLNSDHSTSRCRGMTSTSPQDMRD